MSKRIDELREELKQAEDVGSVYDVAKEAIERLERAEKVVAATRAYLNASGGANWQEHNGLRAAFEGYTGKPMWEPWP